MGVIAQYALEPRGFEVLIATSGQEALAIYEREHATLDAVIIDLVLPDTDGAEVVKGMTAIDASVPIIASSGYGREEARPALDAGAAEFFPKPLNLTELPARLADMMGAPAAG